MRTRLLSRGSAEDVANRRRRHRNRARLSRLAELDELSVAVQQTGRAVYDDVFRPSRGEARRCDLAARSELEQEGAFRLLRQHELQISVARVTRWRQLQARADVRNVHDFNQQVLGARSLAVDGDLVAFGPRRFDHALEQTPVALERALGLV